MIERFETSVRMSQAVKHGDTVYLAGQIADDAEADIEDQTRQILSKIDRLLADAGTDKSKLISANIWLTDMKDFAAMNMVWDAWVAEGQAPARACVGAPLALSGLKVEIAAIATT